jgi:hypothetical protein
MSLAGTEDACIVSTNYKAVEASIPFLRTGRRKGGSNMRKVLAIGSARCLVLTALPSVALAGNPQAIRNRWTGVGIGAAVVTFGGLLLSGLQALVVAARPPVVYSPPTVVYAPPPAVYAPPPSWCVGVGDAWTHLRTHSTRNFALTNEPGSRHAQHHHRLDLRRPDGEGATVAG